MRGVARLAAAAALFAAGCGGQAPAGGPPAPTLSPVPPPAHAAAGADPREDGLEVALGEWALTAEAEAIRPGAVTFVIVNRGALPHGFEIENETGQDDAVKAETRLLEPGESVELALQLAPGVYKLECLVEGHDDLGMELLIEVRKDAPIQRERSNGTGGRTTVSIAGFAYEPQELEIAAGETVTWTNEDEAGHTVTHEGDAFASETLARGGTFERRFDRPGRYRYLCALHPEMRGAVVVTR